ncbi:hypothetical protein M378DRAFT_11826, partial [Amanita muscaria Koide BX008]
PKPRPLNKSKGAQRRNEDNVAALSGHQNVSRRQQAREQEVPIWNPDNGVPQTTNAIAQSSVPQTAPSNTDEGFPQPTSTIVQTSVTPTTTPNIPNVWHPSAILHLNSVGDVNLRDQSTELRVVIQSAIHKITSWIIFQDAFPSILTRAKWNRDALLHSCSEFIECSQPPLKESYMAIRWRVSQDTSFVKNIGRLPDARISIYRGGFKSACVQIVRKFYHLNDGCAETVADLLDENKYIFCLTANNQVIGYKPFEHPAIAEAIKQRLFDEIRHPITEEFPELFKEGEKLTQSIVAFAATAASSIFKICAALQEWSTGKRIAQEFTAQTFTDIYLNHMILLDVIKKNKPRAHDHLLTRLYRVAANNRFKKRTGTAYLDIQNMETDDF